MVSVTKKSRDFDSVRLGVHSDVLCDEVGRSWEQTSRLRFPEVQPTITFNPKSLR